MAAVSKGSGRYFFDFERVWTEARDAGVLPFWVGPAPAILGLGAEPNPQAVQALSNGRAYLKHVQANRVGCFDLTFSFSKSVSLLAYGLTPPKAQKAWTETFTRIATPEVEKLLSSQRINSGPQGKQKLASFGLAAAFPHREGFRGQPQAHVHYAVFNLSATPDRKVGSIANARELFQAQGVLRARVQKGLDDELRARGIETVRVGKKVELAGVPRELIEELSPSRRAIEAAREAKGFSGARALDFYAREARRELGARVHKTPEECHRDCKEVAARYGVTLDSLTRGKAAPRDPATEMAAAFHVAKEAVKSCARRHGAFTTEQFYERLYTLGIGRPTTLDSLDAMGRSVLRDRSIAGVKGRTMPDGSVRYVAGGSAKVSRENARTYRADTKEAWEEVKAAARGLGAAVLVQTARKATAVVERLAEAVNPPPRAIRVDAGRLPELVDRLRPTPYLLAHGKALWAGIARARGNPHDRAAHAEGVFESLRSHERLPKNSVVVVSRGGLASPRDLRLLAKVAKRDGASVVLSECDRLQHLQQQSHQRWHTREL
ncbi:MAG: hypothetical protein KatS3mg108_2620 [Isosphaeraceae bacterium]|jgi:conjugative relaxase-like TrwC/TraI family protein|nr:MAG: hypothetical protein KatS3mg108_2620 [Isosphaeraceae bacterium]